MTLGGSITCNDSDSGMLIEWRRRRRVLVVSVLWKNIQHSSQENIEKGLNLNLNFHRGSSIILFSIIILKMFSNLVIFLLKKSQTNTKNT
jgi:hypothetical protein